MAHAFDELLELAEVDIAHDLVWGLGDLVDRGPFSERCLDLLKEPWFRSIRGNHEQLMLDAVVDRDAWIQWLINGGDWAHEFPWRDPQVRARLLDLPLAVDLQTAVGHFGLIHADVDRICTWPELLVALEEDIGLARQAALWSRISANQAMRGLPERPVPDVDLVLVGHSIVEQPLPWGNMLFLDSGAVVSDAPTASLSMLEIHPELKLWSVPTAGDPVAVDWWASQVERIRRIAQSMDLC